MIADLKQLYSRRTKKEKILTVLVMVAMVAVMLLVCARGEHMPVEKTTISALLTQFLLWVVADNVSIYGLAVFCFGVLPLMVLSAGIIDEISQKKTALALPFYFYLLLFFCERLFYEPMAYTALTWITLLVFAFLLFLAQTGRRGKFFYAGIVFLGICIGMEAGAALLALLWYLLFLGVNTGVAFLMNRLSVLKKKYWYLSMFILYVGLFFVGRLG